jgi:3-hydroxy-5-methyl-1-naphthoate 3-O-methyltransferase
MPLRLNPLERLGLLWMNKGPGPMVDLAGALLFKAVATAVRLDLFESFARAPMTITQAVHTLGYDREGLELLCRILADSGYLRKTSGGVFRLTPLASRWMLRSSPECIAGFFDYYDDCLSRWDYLPETIRTGTPCETADGWLQDHPGSWERYHSGMAALAKLIAPEIIDRCLRSRRRLKIRKEPLRLLDLGGSHGIYACSFVAAFPHLEAVIMDLEAAEESAGKTIEEAGLRDRVAFAVGDFLQDPLDPSGEGIDIVLLFNVLRIYDRRTVEGLLRRIGTAVGEEGMLLIVDQFGCGLGSPFTRINDALVRLELYNSTRGQTYTMGQCADMARASGFGRVKTHPLRSAPGIGLISCR